MFLSIPSWRIFHNKLHVFITLLITSMVGVSGCATTTSTTSTSAPERPSTLGDIPVVVDEVATIDYEEMARALIEVAKTDFELPQNHFKSLADAIKAIPNQGEIADAEKRINEALEGPTNKDTTAAEAIFQEVFEKK